MLQILLLVAFAFAILIAIFAVQNTTPVNVLALTFEIREVPLAVLILASAALGATVAVLVSFAWQIRRGYSHWRERRKWRQELRRLQDLERERDELRYQVQVLQSDRSAGEPAPELLEPPGGRRPDAGTE